MTLVSLRRLFRMPPRIDAAPLAASEAYALWADSYPPWAHNPLMQVEQAVVAPIIAASAPRRALDVGSGTGRYLPVLAAAGARVAVAVDASMAMLARQTAGRPRVCGSACCLPFRDARFDLVCSSLMAGDLPDVSEWVAEAARVLKPGGHLVYSDFHPAWREAGWRRTFRTPDGAERELEYFPHAIDDHLAALERAALEVRAIREPRGPARPLPLVAVFHAVKPYQRP